MATARPKLQTNGLPIGESLREGLEIAPCDFAELINHSATRVAIVDVRLKEEFEAARVPGSIHIPVDEIERRADEVRELEADVIGVMCHHGVRSLRAASALQALGVPQARSIYGGIDLWSWAVDQGVPRYERNGARVWLVDPATPQ
ncbi:MAG: rhodanese-like domain-containing protein [Phycisphaerales bacterium]